MITIALNNNDSADIYATVIDNNLNPAGAVPGANGCRINQNSPPINLQIQEDGNGYGNIAWTAVRCNDATATKAGQATPANFDQVDVTAY